MVITLRLWKGNDGTVGCQMLVYCLTSGVTVALRILCKRIFCRSGFGFISCYAHLTVKMLLYILVAAIRQTDFFINPFMRFRQGN